MLKVVDFVTDLKQSSMEFHLDIYIYIEFFAVSKLLGDLIQKVRSECPIPI